MSEFITKATLEQIKEIAGWLNLTEEDAVTYAVQSLYWQVIPQDKVFEKVIAQLPELSDFIYSGAEKLTKFQEGGDAPDLAKLPPDQIQSLKSWLMLSQANIDVLNMLVKRGKE